MDIDKEVKLLQEFIIRLAKERNEASGKYEVTFGVLFDDDRCANEFEALVGTLRAAKKRKVVDFKGQMLLKGAHDDVIIKLLIED